MEEAVEMSVKPEKRGITGSTIKLIAIIAMFIDHAGAIIVERMLMNQGMGTLTDADSVMAFMQQNANLYYADMILRLIGRLGFPIFCFLLIEGFCHTHNIKKYAGRLFVFALISEIPFDIAFAGEAFYWGYQNVFFTLLIGLLVIIGFRFIEGKREWNKTLRIILYFAFFGAGMAAAQFMHTDYSMFGVLTIAVMYLFKRNKTLSAGMGCAILTMMSLTEITSFFTLIPIHMYNGKRGWNIKWLFYAFYPVHILLLYLVACALGLGHIELR